VWIVQVGQLDTPQVGSTESHQYSHGFTGIIIFTTQILSVGLRKPRQPRVIAEVLGGILLGMTLALFRHVFQLIQYAMKVLLPLAASLAFPNSSFPQSLYLTSLSLRTSAYVSSSSSLGSRLIQRSSAAMHVSPLLSPQLALRSHSDSELHSLFHYIVTSSTHRKFRTLISCSLPALHSRSQLSRSCVAF